jgi:hypothetical protein
MYQLDSLPVSKKPSAYLPFGETSLPPLTSGWAAEMVSVVAELGGACKQKSAANTKRNRGMMS